MSRGPSWLLSLLLLTAAGCVTAAELRGTGDLGVIIERADGSLLIVEHSGNSRLGRVTGLGDLSHASVVFSRDQRYAYIFGRDGGLSKVDILTRQLVKRVMQSGNSIGGAISQDGRLIAVSNYEPGGVKVFDANSLQLVADIPASYGDGQQSKTVGLVDAPDGRFVFSLYEAEQIWIADLSDRNDLKITRFEGVGKLPYDALISPSGRHYIAGLFGEEGLAYLDLWHPERGVQKILKDYGQHDEKLPVYKMPHLEGWAMAGDIALVPAVGQHKVLVMETRNWQQIGAIDVVGQPVFVMARPDGRQIWVNFAFPDNHYLQVIDAESLTITHTLEPGKGVLHMEFTPRGEAVWASVRDADRIDIFDTRSVTRIGHLPAEKPSGIFFTSRAHQTGL